MRGDEGCTGPAGERGGSGGSRNVDGGAALGMEERVVREGELALRRLLGAPNVKKLARLARA